MSYSGNILWLASYPRSGNTWLRLLINESLSPTESADSARVPREHDALHDRELLNDLLGIDLAEIPADEAEAQWARACRYQSEQSSERFLVKTHKQFAGTEATRTVLRQATAGVILLVRNPADVSVSLAAFFNLSINQAVQTLADDGFTLHQPRNGMLEWMPQHVGSWSGHARSWRESGMPLLIVRYEDLLQHTFNELSRILQFCGFQSNPARIRLAIKKLNITNLQQTEPNMRGLGTPPSIPAFFGPGRAGIGANRLTSTQLRDLTAHHHDVMVRFDYE